MHSVNITAKYSFRNIIKRKEFSSEDGGSIFLRNVGISLPISSYGVNPEEHHC
jgi:hypothetical protein